MNFNKFKSGGLYERNTAATWNFGIISACTRLCSCCTYREQSPSLL